MKERIFLTMPCGSGRDEYFPKDCMDELHRIGEVKLNPLDRNPTERELAEMAADSTILLTHWGTPQICETFLDAAPNLWLIAHCTGTVAHIASEESYRRGIRCLSANAIMAKYVAEDVLGLMIASLRNYKQNDIAMQRGEWRQDKKAHSLFNQTIGFVGLGTVGKNLLNMLRPFEIEAFVYDPYLPQGALNEWENAKQVTLDQALDCGIVTIHASQTPETYHMIGKNELKKMRDDAVLINTSRGSLLDSEAAIAELKSGRLRAAIDVFDRDGVVEKEWLGIDNALLQPHLAGLPAGAAMTRGIIEDINRILSGQNSKLEVPLAQFRLMTQE